MPDHQMPGCWKSDVKTTGLTYPRICEMAACQTISCQLLNEVRKYLLIIEWTMYFHECTGMAISIYADKKVSFFSLLLFVQIQTLSRCLNQSHRRFVIYTYKYPSFNVIGYVICLGRARRAARFGSNRFPLATGYAISYPISISLNFLRFVPDERGGDSAKHILDVLSLRRTEQLEPF